MAFFNQIKTVLLLGILTGILLGLGYLLGGTSGLTIGLIFALVMNILSFWFSDKIVLFMYRAKEASKSQYPGLYNIVDEICKQANMQKPLKIYIIPSESPNAMCTGRSPKHYILACTQGILKLLNREELKGVLAHEVAHAKNRDILIATIAAVIAGTISYIAIITRYSLMFGRDRERSSANIIALLILAIIVPIAATIIQLAISRTREYLADATGSKFIKNAEPLAKALEKLEYASKKIPMKNANPSTAHLFIVKPFSAEGLLSLFSTHPATSSRIQKLKELKF